VGGGRGDTCSNVARTIRPEYTGACIAQAMATSVVPNRISDFVDSISIMRTTLGAATSTDEDLKYFLENAGGVAAVFLHNKRELTCATSTDGSVEAAISHYFALDGKPPPYYAHVQVVALRRATRAAQCEHTAYPCVCSCCRTAR
jgi:hypothetical protein